MLDSCLCMQEDLEKDNGHSLVLALKRSGTVSVKTVHKENGTIWRIRLFSWLLPFRWFPDFFRCVALNPRILLNWIQRIYSSNSLCFFLKTIPFVFRVWCNYTLVLVRTSPTAQVPSALKDSLSRGHDPYTHAYEARPLTLLDWLLWVSSFLKSWKESNRSRISRQEKHTWEVKSETSKHRRNAKKAHVQSFTKICTHVGTMKEKMRRITTDDLRTIATMLTMMKILKTMHMTSTSHNLPWNSWKEENLQTAKESKPKISKELTKKRQKWHMKSSTWSCSKTPWLPAHGKRLWSRWSTWNGDPTKPKTTDRSIPSHNFTSFSPPWYTHVTPTSTNTKTLTRQDSETNSRQRNTSWHTDLLPRKAKSGELTCGWQLSTSRRRSIQYNMMQLEIS